MEMEESKDGSGNEMEGMKGWYDQEMEESKDGSDQEMEGLKEWQLLENGRNERMVVVRKWKE